MVVRREAVQSTEVPKGYKKFTYFLFNTAQLELNGMDTCSTVRRGEGREKKFIEKD